MDGTDRKLLVLIVGNPRIPYRELADKLGISVQATHRRIQVLMRMKVIRQFSAEISMRYLKAVPVAVFGRSNTSSMENTVKKLAENELSSSALVAGGNELFAVGLLKSISDLEPFTEFVKRVGEMPNPTVGIYSTDAGLAPDYMDGGKKSRSEFKPLTPLDLRIIRALHRDCRKSVTDVAEEVGVSAKTVARRLQGLIDEGAVDFVVPMDPTSTGDIVSLVQINLKDGANKKELGAKCINKFSPHVWYLRSFSNIPNFLLCITCTDTMSELRTLLGAIGKEPMVKSIVPNIWYEDHLFDTWRDKLLYAKEPTTE